MSDFVLMDEEAWFDTYRPIANFVEGGTLGECGMRVDDVGYMYETYGPDLTYVELMFHNSPHSIWTQVEEDGVSEIVNGFRRVNRLGYFVTEYPFKPSESQGMLVVPMWDDNETLDPNFCEECED